MKWPKKLNITTTVEVHGIVKQLVTENSNTATTENSPSRFIGEGSDLWDFLSKVVKTRKQNVRTKQRGAAKGRVLLLFVSATRFPQTLMRTLQASLVWASWVVFPQRGKKNKDKTDKKHFKYFTVNLGIVRIVLHRAATVRILMTDKCACLVRWFPAKQFLPLHLVSRKHIQQAFQYRTCHFFSLEKLSLTKKHSEKKWKKSKRTAAASAVVSSCSRGDQKKTVWS